MDLVESVQAILRIPEKAAKQEEIDGVDWFFENEHSTIFHMAAAYGFHLCQNHPFLDGNKRAAGMVMLTFLQLNGLEPTATEIDYYQAMMAVASGSMSKEQLADWLQTATNGIPPEIA